MNDRLIVRCLVAPLLAVASAGALAVAPILASGSADAALVPHTAHVSSHSDGRTDHRHHHRPAYDTVYVSASPNHRYCGRNPYTTITAALAAVPKGGQVVVCAGTYSEDVVVSQAVTIVGRHAVVEPSSADTSPIANSVNPGNNAFTVVASHVTITGFTVEGATGDGIITDANDTRLTDDRATDNGGTGFDLNGASRSAVTHDIAKGNTGGGVYVTDDYGTPASHNVVADNVLVDNLDGCGVILADHSAAGIFDNLIVGNVIDDNGDNTTEPGAGVILASPVPGGAVYKNVIAFNRISGNGLGGVTLHDHASTGDFSGNIVIGNDIGTNNVEGSGSAAVGADDGDAVTTGIYLGSVESLSITIIGNVIHKDQDGIYAAGTSTSTITVHGSARNRFLHVVNDVVSVSTYAG